MGRFAVMLGITCWALAAPQSDAQETRERRYVVRLTTLASDGSTLASVNLAISRADVGALFAGKSTDAGVYTFTIATAPGSYSVLARLPGYALAESAFVMGQLDTITMALTLRRLPPSLLDPITIEATRSNYVLGAAEIAASRRPVRDAFEVLQKLRPSMLYDRDRCKAEVVENVWVNGRRVLFMAKNVPILGARGGRTVGGVQISTPGGGSRSEPPAIDSLLASIQAEHLLEIRLVNCWDNSMPGVGGKNALYVALKPGVDWDRKRGSFIADSSEYYRRP